MKEIEQISSGTYGCIYYPSIPCEKETRHHKDKRFISKIQIENSVSKMEWELSQEIIKNIPEYSFYFSPIVKKCTVDLKQIKKDQQCKILDKETDDDDKETDDDGKETDDDDKETMSYKIKYIGKETMDDVLTKWYKTLNMKSFVLKMVDALTFVLFSIQKLQEKTMIIHNDLKLNNIMYNPINKTPTIIDFGLSIYKKPESIQRMTNKVFWLYCFDSLILGRLYDEKTDTVDSEFFIDSLTQFVTTNFLFDMDEEKDKKGEENDEKVEKKKKENIFDEKETKQFIQKYKERIQEWTTRTNRLELIDYIFNSTSHEWDMYSFFVSNVLNIQYLPKTKDNENNAFIKKMEYYLKSKILSTEPVDIITCIDELNALRTMYM